MNLTTTEGHSLRLTCPTIACAASASPTGMTSAVQTEWCAAGDLKPGDKVLMQDHRKAQFGVRHAERGYLLGLLIGDGISRTAVHEGQQAAAVNLWGQTARRRHRRCRTSIDCSPHLADCAATSACEWPASNESGHGPPR